MTAVLALAVLNVPVGATLSARPGTVRATTSPPGFAAVLAQTGNVSATVLPGLEERSSGPVLGDRLSVSGVPGPADTVDRPDPALSAIMPVAMAAPVAVPRPPAIGAIGGHRDDPTAAAAAVAAEPVVAAGPQLPAAATPTATSAPPAITVAKPAAPPQAIDVIANDLAATIPDTVAAPDLPHALPLTAPDQLVSAEPAAPAPAAHRALWGGKPVAHNHPTPDLVPASVLRPASPKPPAALRPRPADIPPDLPDTATIQPFAVPPALAVPPVVPSPAIAPAGTTPASTPAGEPHPELPRIAVASLSDPSARVAPDPAVTTVSPPEPVPPAPAAPSDTPAPSALVVAAAAPAHSAIAAIAVAGPAPAVSAQPFSAPPPQLPPSVRAASLVPAPRPARQARPLDATALPASATPAPTAPPAPDSPTRIEVPLRSEFPLPLHEQTVRSDRLGDVTVRVDGASDALTVRLGIDAPVLPVAVADAPRLVAQLAAELAAAGHRLHSLSFDTPAGGQGRQGRDAPPPTPARAWFRVDDAPASAPDPAAHRYA